VKHEKYFRNQNMKTSNFFSLSYLEEGALFRISRKKFNFYNPEQLCCEHSHHHTSQQPSQIHTMEPTSASSGPRVEGSNWPGRMSANKE